MAKVVYWVATALVTAELVAGGMWDVLRVSEVRGVVEHLRYPSYFLVILGVWKLLGALALLAPGFPLLKEWAYAGVFFADSGAIVSHLAVGHQVGELAFLIPLTGLTVLSWALRPAGRRIRGGDGRPIPAVFKGFLDVFGGAKSDDFQGLSRQEVPRDDLSRSRLSCRATTTIQPAAIRAPAAPASTTRPSVGIMLSPPGYLWPHSRTVSGCFAEASRHTAVPTAGPVDPDPCPTGRSSVANR